MRQPSNACWLAALLLFCWLAGASCRIIYQPVNDSTIPNITPNNSGLPAVAEQAVLKNGHHNVGVASRHLLQAAADIVGRYYCGAGTRADPYATGATWTPFTATTLPTGAFGTVTTLPISRSEKLQFVYQSSCIGPIVRVKVPVPAPGNYLVTLMGAEPYWTTAGRRVFDVAVEGLLLLQDADLVRDAGATYTAQNYTMIVPTTDTFLTLIFSPTFDQPTFSGLIVANAPAAPPPPAGNPAINIYCDSYAFTDASGKRWTPIGSSPYVPRPPGVALGPVYGGTIAEAGTLARVYRTECIALPSILFPGTPGTTYAVSFYFSENYFTKAGSRIFSVLIGNQVVLPEYDIVADKGVKTAVKKTFYVNTTADGSILVNFVSIVDQAHLSGITVEPFTTDPTAPLPSPPPPAPSPLPASPLPIPSPVPSPLPPPPVSANAVFQMYCGTGTFIDDWGGAWADNTAFQLAPGTAFAATDATIINAPLQLMKVYQTECFAGVLSLNIPVPAADDYDVIFLNAENYFGADDARVFSVAAEDTVVLPDLDIFHIAGAKHTAVNNTFRVTVSDGTLNLKLTATKDNARFGGIVVRRSSSTTPLPPPTSPPVPSPVPSPTPSPTVVPTSVATWCGVDPLTDGAGILWQSRAFITGAAYSALYDGGIVNAAPDVAPIYASECAGPDFSVTFTGLAAGDYTVSILAAETYFTTQASRVFSISVQGTQVLSAVDLYKDFGALTAATFTYVVPNVASTITFRFVASINQARIGGIVITPGARAGVPVIAPAASPAPTPPAPGPTPGPSGVIPPIKIPADPSAPALSINYNGPAFTDSLGHAWVPATPYVAGCFGGGTGAPITGAPADLQQMLQSECFGPSKTTIPVQNTGTYLIRIWNSEIFFTAANLRIFDVVINDLRLISNWDIVSDTGGRYVGQYKEVTVPVTTANIVIELRPLPGADQPTIKGLQLVYLSSSTFAVQPTPSSYSFQLVDPTNPINNKFTVTFQALLPTAITGIRVQKLQPAVFPDQAVFKFAVPPGGSSAIADTAASTSVIYDAPIALSRGQFISIEGSFFPVDTAFYACKLEIMAGITVVSAVLFDGTGDLSANVPHVLHVVADGPRFLVDVDGAGALPVTFDATPSHTHDPAHRIVAYQWADVTAPAAPAILGTGLNVTRNKAPGAYAWNLTIFDDTTPTPNSKVDTINFNVYPATAVPGTFVKFFLGTTAANLTSDLDAALPQAAARMPGFWLVAPLPARVTGLAAIAQMKASYTVPAGGTSLTVAAGADGHTVPSSILVNGTAVNAGDIIPAGTYNIEVRVFVRGSIDVPVNIQAGGVLVGQNVTKYNEAQQGPVINSISPVQGIVIGGTRVTVQGIGWRMSDVQVTVGDVVIPNSDIVQYTASSFYFFTPAVSGPSSTTITVTSKGKTSNSATYTYLAADQPVPNFLQTPFTWSGEFNGVTTGQWCHGRFFFSGASGYLYEVSFNDDYTLLTNVTRYDGLTQNAEVKGRLVLGLACNPFESSERFKIWLTHSDMFNPYQDPTSDVFKGVADYSAAVGYFQWPEMNNYTVVIDNLPCATVFHSVASLGFDNKGVLYIGVGAQTNTGAPAPRFGNLAESPWSAGMIRADVMNPNFKGRIQYEIRADAPATVQGKNPNDQVYGGWVKTVASSTRGMEMFAYGLRNPLGLTFHTNGNLYTCDNGPNGDSGPALLSPYNYSPEYVGTLYDRIDLVEYNTYHGIGNENRAVRGDPRQGTYIAREPSDKYYRPSFSDVVNGVPVNYTEPIGLVLSSSNGMDEYRSNTFLGAMRGWLLISKLATFMYFVKLSPDGRSVLDVKKDTELNLPQVPSLKTITGPGGIIVGIDFDSNSLRVLTPVDTAATVAGLTYIYDVFPWRAPKNIPAGKTFPFIISGANFDKLEAPIRVFFGGQEAVNAVRTNSKSIRGTVPAWPAAPSGLIDITITTATGSSFKLPRAFQYIDDYTVQLDGPSRW